MARSLWLTRLLVRSRLARFVPAARRLADGGTAFLHYYSDKVLAAPVEELLDSAYFPISPGPDVIDLAQPAPVAESGRIAFNGRSRPPARGLPELRDAISDGYIARDGRAVDPAEEVLVTHGATGAFAAALDAFVNPGDRVVLFDPCSPLFALGAQSRRARVRWVPTWMEDGRCRFLEDGLQRAMRGAKLLVLSDPGNPAGGCFDADDLERIAWFAAAYDVLLYADETFARYRYDGRGRSLAVLPGGENRTLTAGSLSAGHGLSSLRVGWLAGPRHLIRACILTANLSAPHVPAACQQVAARALAEGEADFAPVRDRFRAKRQYACDRLAAMALEPDRPAGGYFLWVPVAALGLNGRTFAERLLKEQRVLVGPGCAFGPSGGGHVRISFAADDGRLREGLSRLAAFVAGLKKTPAPEVVEEAAEPVELPQPAFSRVC